MFDEMENNSKSDYFFFFFFPVSRPSFALKFGAFQIEFLSPDNLKAFENRKYLKMIASECHTSNSFSTHK